MARVARRQGLPASTHIPDIHAGSEFQAILSYERARADRAGTRFALVALELAAHSGDKGELARLTRALLGRIRSTDVLGWLEPDALGVLLPCTDLEGGWIFAVNFQKQYYVDRAPAPFTVYCYPDQWLHGGNGSGSCGEPRNRQGNLDRRVDGCLERSFPRWKRALDVVGSLLGITAGAPLFLAMAAYIKLVSPGPVFFRQERIGYRARPFSFLKFRTMHVNNDASQHKAYLKQLINSDQPMEKLDAERDPRIIPGGKVIRKACLDELPQLLNVLKGEMSLVGPRPCLPYEAEEYLRWHTNRFDSRPGMTGLWQVSGKNALTFKQMIRLDISYCREMSLARDLVILLRTPMAIAGFVLEATVNRLRGRSASPAPEPVAEPLAICQVLEYFAERF